MGHGSSRDTEVTPNPDKKNFHIHNTAKIKKISFSKTEKLKINKKEINLNPFNNLNKQDSIINCSKNYKISIHSANNSANDLSIVNSLNYKKNNDSEISTK